MTKSFPRDLPEFQHRGGFLERSDAAMKSAARNDDHTRSPAAERRRRRFNGMRVSIMGGI